MFRLKILKAYFNTVKTSGTRCFVQSYFKKQAVVAGTNVNLAFGVVYE